ncbi:MAG: hypothetical protein PHG05_01995 [Candidatus Nanoarchaeia archaeon]|nr:hypothetical protein [Candidatus Nanoarchaeia archaeon]
MPKTLYLNMFCNSLHYPGLFHLNNSISKLKEGDKLILCFWDQTLYPFQAWTDLSKEDYKILLEKLKSLLDYHKINYKVIYLSDAFARLTKNEEAFNLLYSILGKISLKYLAENFEEKDTNYQSITINKITFTIADYLIAVYINKLFPELKINKITDYYVGSKLKYIINKVEETISEKNIILDHPRKIYAPRIPILNYESGRWISVGMSRNEVEREVEKAYSNGISLSEIKLLLSALSELIGKDIFISKDFKIEKVPLNYVFEVLPDLNKKDIINTLSENLYVWIEIIKIQLLDAGEAGIRKINYIKNREDLRKILSFLNPQKLEIIKLCNGERNVEEIVKLSSLKESSTRSYLSRLRAKDIITKDDKPKKKVDEILISFD